MVEKSKLHKFWSGQINKSKKREQNWRSESDHYIKIYADGVANHHGKPNSNDLAAAPFNILWSNIEILKAATLSKVAQPNVTRRHKDGATTQAKTALIEAQQSQDQAATQRAQQQLQAAERAAKTAKETSEIMERGLEFIQDKPAFIRNLRQARDDMLLPGRGVMWYEYHTETQLFPMDRQIIAGEDEEEIEVFLFNGAEEEPDERDESGNGFFEDIVDQSVVPKYVYWKDYLQSDSRSEELVWWKARRHGMSVDQIEAQLNLDEKRMAKLFPNPQAQNDEETEVLEVWEIWSKPKKQRIWYTENAEDTLLEEDVPLTLEDFFPCPKPMFPFETTNTMVPVPEYRIYKALATELNRIEKRLSRLTETFKVAGVYDGAKGADVQNLGDLEDGQFKPIGDAKNFGADGGMRGAFFELPLAGTAAVIDKLEARKVILKREIFEITGISDVIRGDTNAQETATAQRLKGSFGSLRLRPRREPVEEFIRDGYNIMGEIMADKFLPETFARMTGLNPSEQVMQLLRDDAMRNFTIDVETDSTVQPNQEIDQRSAVEFATAIGTFFQQALPLVQAAPQMAPLVMESIKFVARRFKAGRALEEEINRLTAQIVRAAENPPPQQEDPQKQIEMFKSQLQVMAIQADLQGKQMDNETKERVAEINAQIKVFDIQQRARDSQLKSFTTIRANELDVKAANVQ